MSYSPTTSTCTMEINPSLRTTLQPPFFTSTRVLIVNSTSDNTFCWGAGNTPSRSQRWASGLKRSRAVKSESPNHRSRSRSRSRPGPLFPGFYKAVVIRNPAVGSSMWTVISGVRPLGCDGITRPPSFKHCDYTTERSKRQLVSIHNSLPNRNPMKRTRSESPPSQVSQISAVYALIMTCGTRTPKPRRNCMNRASGCSASVVFWVALVCQLAVVL
jgi:hypothetical protein